MEAEQVAAAEDEAPPPRRHRGLVGRVAKWVGIILALLLLAVAGLYFGLNTELGRRYVTKQINNLEMASGLDIDVGRIEGSIYGELTIHGLVLKDPKGVFFRAPIARLDWRPFSYFQNHIDIRELEIPTARLMRLPELLPSDPNAPLLPDLDIDIGRLHIGRLQVDAAVTGRRHLLTFSGQAKIADGRAQIAANAEALVAPGVAGGDRLKLRLDAVPEANKFDLDAHLISPADGFVTGLAGLDQQIEAAVSGSGNWKNWSGRARAALGGDAIANLAVAAKDGTFTVTGPVRPGLLLDGQLKELTQPFVQLNLVTSFDQRRADTRLRLRSQALALAAEGVFDLGQSQFENVRVAARLLQPTALAPNLRGRDVRVAMVLNGGFATPRVAYDLQADALGFGETVVEGLRARGSASVGTDRLIIPVSAQARRITGLNEALGGLLTNVSLNGTFRVSGSRILSDDLRIRSDRLDGTAIIVADLERGQYRAGLQGRVNNYLVEGIGLLDITSDLDVVTQGQGFGISGRVAIETRRIDNESARDFLGGSAVASANIEMDDDGVIRFDRLRLSSPQLRITSGSGTYRPDGRIDLRAAGVSEQYGPLTVFVTGTPQQPQVRLRAERPNFGIGLRGVDAEIRSTAQGYAITASGQSEYGPFTADLVILSGSGPLTAQVNLVRIAGVELRGRVSQTAAGPFTGRLELSGSGLDGVIRLGAAGRYQRAEISARANGFRVPGQPPILIQRGIIDATAILYSDAPSIVGEAQLAGVRRGDLLIDEARVRVNYRGGRGDVQLVARGSNGVPFNVALNANLTPDHVRANARGTINRLPFRLAQPADIRKVGGDWQLSPTSIIFPQGSVRVAARFGESTIIRTRVEGVDVSIVNAFVPGLGLGGSATGSVDFSLPPGGAFPRADARLNIENFVRKGVTTLSAPVNVALVGTLRPEGGAVAAVIRRSGKVIGRVQARLQPLSPGAGSWTTRLLAAPLSGGIRYNGPAELLWSLTGIADQQLSGPIGIAADFSGRVQDPQLTGVIRANALTFEDETYGTRITNLALQGQFNRSTLQITRLAGRAGSGTVTGSGTVGFAADAGFPIDVRLNLNAAQLARSDDLGATATGEIRITNSRSGGARISGDLRLPEVRYRIIRQGAAEVAELEGVRRRGEPLRPPAEMSDDAPAAPSIWQLDLRVRADNGVFVSGMGLESEWETDLRVTGTSSSPRVTGAVEVIRGTYSFAGNRFDLTDGRISFTGSQPIEPRIDISASGEADGVTVTINVTGSALDPQISFTSTPALPQDEIMARLLFGGSVTELSALQAVQLGASLNSLRGGSGGLNPLGKLQSATGIDRLRILGADEATGRGTAISAGFYISNDIYIELITDARGFTATQLEIALSRTLSILSQAGSSGSTSVNVRYSRDY